MPVSSPTSYAAVQGLTQSQNIAVLDGTVAAIAGNGELIVVSQGITILPPAVLIDHVFQVGEPVILGRTDDDEWVVTGVGETRTANPGVPSPMRFPTTASSATLHEAMLRWMQRRNQILKKGTVIGIHAEGSLVVRLKVGDVMGRAETTQYFDVGQVVYAIHHDDDSWRILGSQ